MRPALVCGLLGAYATFATFSRETLRLVQTGSLPAATANVAGSLTGALPGVYLGIVLARAM